MKKKKKKKLFGIYLGEFEAGIDSFNFSGCYKLRSKKKLDTLENFNGNSFDI